MVNHWTVKRNALELIKTFSDKNLTKLFTSFVIMSGCVHQQQWCRQCIYASYWPQVDVVCVVGCVLHCLDQLHPVMWHGCTIWIYISGSEVVTHSISGYCLSTTEPLARWQWISLEIVDWWQLNLRALSSGTRGQFLLFQTITNQKWHVRFCYLLIMISLRCEIGSFGWSAHWTHKILNIANSYKEYTICIFKLRVFIDCQGNMLCDGLKLIQHYTFGYVKYCITYSSILQCCVDYIGNDSCM